MTSSNPASWAAVDDARPSAIKGGAHVRQTSQIVSPATLRRMLAYTIIDRCTANPIARLRPIPDTDRFELFYWSSVKGRWTTFGNLGRMKLMLESAHEIIESDPMFRIPRSR